MIEKLIAKVIGTKYERDWKKAQPTIRRINQVWGELEELSDEDLQGRTDEFRKRLTEGEPLNDLLPEAFAVVKETCRRMQGLEYEVAGYDMQWDMVPYDVQLFGGLSLHNGKISEMATGEGKTLVAVAPVYLNALEGKGVHLVTVNDYLARRDADWMGAVYRRLGLTVGCIQHGQDPEERRAQYQADVTYGTNNEFGFDYLRDNMAVRLEDRVQTRGHNFAIVDEVDSVLIDEARTPLIISGPVAASERDRYYMDMRPAVDKIVRQQQERCSRWVKEAEAEIASDDDEVRYEAARKLLLVQRGMPKNKRLIRLYKEAGVQKAIARVEADYMREKQLHVLDEELLFAIDEKQHTVTLSDNGIEQLDEEHQNLFLVPDVAELVGEVDAREDLDAQQKADEKDRIEDQAAKNTAKVHCINQLFRAYSLYERDVEYVVQEGKVHIVDSFTGRLMPGRRWSDGLHQAVEAKEGVRVEGENQTLATVTLQNYFRMYSKLAGMTGTAETEAGEFYEIYGLDCEVIPTNEPIRRRDFEDLIYRTRREKYNAIVEEVEECHKIGRPVLVGTVSVDVSEILSRMLKRKNVPHNVLNAKFHEHEAEIVRAAGHRGSVTIATNMAGRGTDIKLGEGVIRCERDCGFYRSFGKDRSAAAPDPPETNCKNDLVCGLHIMGTERHEARRIDRQLRGRSGRQGDPGSSRFYLSLEDNLMRLFGSERIAGIMDRLGVEEGEVIEHGMVTRSIERAQKKVEERNFEIRKRLLEYDDVMNRQREVIYDRRSQALRGEDLRDEMLNMIDEEVEALVSDYVNEATHPDSWNWEGLSVDVARVFTRAPELTMSTDPRAKREEVVDLLLDFARAAYEEREAAFGTELLRRVERAVFLQTVDRLWKDHLWEMDQLKGGISLRSYGQRDPLVEYKKEGFELFVRMLGQLNREVLSVIFRARMAAPDEPRASMDFSGAQEVHEAAGGFSGASAGPTPPPPMGARPPMAAPPMGARPPMAAPPAAARPPAALSGAASIAGRKPPAAVQPTGAAALGGGAAILSGGGTDGAAESSEVGRNDPCPCGSGKKYKKCHGGG